MLKTVDGLYRKGKGGVKRDTGRSPRQHTRLRDLSWAGRNRPEEVRITPDQAAAPRVRLAAFAEDWDRFRKWLSNDDNNSTKPDCKRGDIILVLFPYSDLRTAKLRPSLVVQAGNL
jgi:hypothetical protein